TATVIGLLVLAQRPTGWELIGLGSISVAVALAGRRARSGSAGRTGQLRTGETARATGAPVPREPRNEVESDAAAAPKRSSNPGPEPATDAAPELVDGPDPELVDQPADESDIESAEEPVDDSITELAADPFTGPAADPAADP